jgi:hypothetical protein
MPDGGEAPAAPDGAVEAPAPLRVAETELIAPDELRREVESSAPRADASTWIVRVLRDGQPAADVEIAWATPEVQESSEALPGDASPDWFGRAWHAGRHTRSDALGEASVPALEAESLLLARDGDALAHHRVGSEDASPIVLALRRDYTLRVRVVDSSGTPRAALDVLADVSDPSRPPRLRATTDSEGVATFFHLGASGALDPDHAGGRVFVDGLFEPPVEAVFGFRAFPEHPLELALPLHGSVEVEVVHASGEPAQVSKPAHLSPVQSSGTLLGKRSTRASSGVVAGRASFPLVQLELTLQAELDDRPDHYAARVRFEGPVRPGEQRTARLVLTPAAVIRFRVLAPSGEPLSGREIVAIFERATAASRSSFDSTVSTDAEGFVRLPVTEPWNEGTRLSLTLRLDSPEGEGMEGSLELSHALAPGVNELGDVHLRHDRVLAAGRVVDGRGQPIRNASVTVERLDSSGPGQETWLPAFSTSTGPDGGFAFRQDPPPEALRVRAGSRDHAPAEPIPFVPGTRGLELQLLQGGGLRGSLRMPEGLPRRALMITASDPEGQQLQTIQPDASGRFEFLGLAPGRVDVSVMLTTENVQLALVEGIEVREGEVRSDPRLEAIELGVSMRRLVIRVRTPSGAPSPRGWVRILSGAAYRTSPTGFLIDEGEAQVFGRAVPLDLEVDVPGHRVVRLAGVESDQEVVLEPSLSVRLALPANVELPPRGARLQVHLTPVGEVAPVTHMNLIADGEFIAFVRQPFGDAVGAFADTREVALELQHAGPHQVGFDLIYIEPERGFTLLPAAAESRLLDVQPKDAGRTFIVAPEPTAYAKALAGMD